MVLILTMIMILLILCIVISAVGLFFKLFSFFANTET